VIVTALVGFVCQAAVVVLGLIPSWTPPTDAFGSTSTQLGSMAAVGNGYFPVVVLGVCLTLVLGLKVALLGWRVVLFIWHQFWGSD